MFPRALPASTLLAGALRRVGSRKVLNARNLLADGFPEEGRSFNADVRVRF